MVSLESRVKAHEPIAKRALDAEYDRALHHQPGKVLETVSLFGLVAAASTHNLLLAGVSGALGWCGRIVEEERKLLIDRIESLEEDRVFYAERERLLYRAHEAIISPSLELDGTLTRYLESALVESVEERKRGFVIEGTHRDARFEGTLKPDRLPYLALGEPVDLIVAGSYPESARVLDVF